MLRSVRRLRCVRRLLAGTALPCVIALADLGFAIGSAGAAPVEYVKVCSLYGNGFYYIPGTNTCARVFVGAEGGYGWSNSNFAVSPPFDVNGTGGVFGINGGVQFGIPGTRVYVGPTVGVLWGDMSGTTANPPASPGNSYDVVRKFIQFSNFTFGHAVSFFDFANGADYAYTLLPSAVEFGFGVANVNTSVACSCGASASNSTTGFNWTAAAIFLATSGGPVAFGSGQIPFNSTAVEFRYRYINVPTANFNIPGTVPISGNINMFTVGLRANFGNPPAPPR